MAINVVSMGKYLLDNTLREKHSLEFLECVKECMAKRERGVVITIGNHPHHHCYCVTVVHCLPRVCVCVCVWMDGWVDVH